MGAVILKFCLFVLGPVVGLKVIQSPPVLSLLTGQTARINCSLTPGEERVGLVKYYWWRTRDNPDSRGNGSRHYLRKSSRLSLSGTGDSLVIRELIVNDSDTYHCLRLEILSRKTIMGEGTKLNVQAKPEVSLSADPDSEVIGIRALTCLAAGFFPSDLNISWIVEGNVSYQTEPGSLTVNRDNTYNLSSRLQITDTHWDQGTAVICEVQHITHSEPVRISFRQSRGVSKFYYFSLLGLILIVPVCLLIMKSQCCKRKNRKDSSIHNRNLDDQIAGKSVNDSVNESNVSLSSETLHYAPVHVSNPRRWKQKRESERPEQEQETEYAVLKVKDKNNLSYEEPVQYSAVCTSNRRQTANYDTTIYASLKQ
ncbi:tyrosine-protein phosphatase non-receptor type substrate 1-like [Scyliorhinus canicula]|uniref:tyrosine-protein phosphatase non-receptor type substrate 1-like n=1 Tax=Scyliorhinus canicula TaxID=7830 RepID=UPI0018F5A8EE|nr:tyrosine-protein phosphatase non-receptor type substrate 1-like [Scyliorhinus canicula]